MLMFASIVAETIKMRRLWLPAISIGSGLVLSALLWLSMSATGDRLATEERMEMPWQSGLIGDVAVSMTLVLPTLVTLLTALCFFVEHRGDMWKQLRATPQPIVTIYAAKFLVIQGLIALALLTLALAAVVGWRFLPDPLRLTLAGSGKEAFESIMILAGVLYVALLPVSLIQFLLSARLPNILHPVGLGLIATFVCLMAMGPSSGPWLPYAYPGVVIIDSFGPDPAEGPEQQTDTEYRAPDGAFVGAPRGAQVLVDHAHSNRHGLGSSGEPGTLGWIIGPAEVAHLSLRSTGRDLTVETLANARLLIIAGASRPLSSSEVDAVVAWVSHGGSLLLLTDHEPFASPAAELGRRLGARFSLVMTPSMGKEGAARVRFSREDRSLAIHPMTEGVRSVLSYGGQALWRSGPDTVRLLQLRGVGAGPDASQLIAFPFERGRVIISGETGLFTAQRHDDGSRIGVADPSADNERLVLNALRWLLRA